MSGIEKVSIADKLGLIGDHWHPRIVGQVNDCHVKLAKLQGEFVWHSHAHEDEMFLVVRGTLTIRLRDTDIVLNEGEFVVIPAGVEHMPVAEQEVHILLFEPAATLNTGDAQDSRTVASPEWI